jgi:hypothetical protein
MVAYVSRPSGGVWIGGGVEASFSPQPPPPVIVLPKLPEPEPTLFKPAVKMAAIGVGGGVTGKFHSEPPPPPPPEPRRLFTSTRSRAIREDQELLIMGVL